MTTRAGRRAPLVRLVTATVAIAATLLPATGAHAFGSGASRPSVDGSVDTTAAGSAAEAAASPAAIATAVADKVAGMTLAEKVGQLFVTYAYGERADSTNPAYVRSNQEMYGVDTAAEAVAKYHLGGIIYFSWTGSLADPTQIARCPTACNKRHWTTPAYRW